VSLWRVSDSFHTKTIGRRYDVRDSGLDELDFFIIVIAQ
jgi:hypothetical protein